LMELHRAAEAEQLLRQVNDGLRRSAPDAPIRGFIMLTFSQCLIANEKWADAEVVSRETWAWDKAHPDPSHPVPESLLLLNQVLEKLHKPIEALPVPASQPASRPDR
jgi:hypothetical protein